MKLLTVISVSNMHSSTYNLTLPTADAGQPGAGDRLYAPATKERIGYNHFLDLLDFKRDTEMRLQFASLLIKYHDTPRRRCLRKEDGDEFTAVVNGFLDEHGAKYFGQRPRSHLVMSDPTVGLFYRRDAQLKES